VTRVPETRCALAALAVLGWALAVGAGLERIWRYEGTPGAAGNAPQRWPGSPLVEPRPGVATLVMFIHPRCSCTRASLAELRAIMERASDRVAAWVLVLRPDDAGDDWSRTQTREAAEGIPNTTVVADADGAEAARFGALTSGQVHLFAADGRLVFAGGITAARGHAGDNSGRRAVLSLLQQAAAPGGAVQEEAAAHDHDVFGCAIHDRNPLETREEERADQRQSPPDLRAQSRAAAPRD
jgi:hypothetical protein